MSTVQVSKNGKYQILTVRSKEKFDLAIDTDSKWTKARNAGDITHQSMNSFESKYPGKRLPADVMPFLVLPYKPNGTYWSGKSKGGQSFNGSSSYVGCIAVIIDHTKKKAVFCVIGDVGGGNSSMEWHESSLACAWMLGHSEASGNIGAESTYTIKVCPSYHPDWKSVSNDKIGNKIIELGTTIFGDIDNIVTSCGEVDENSTDGSTTYQKPDVDASKIDPYVITANRNSSKLNFNKLSKARVIGALFEAGYLFDSSHNRVSTFRSPKLEEQVEGANKADMPYGLYITSRAKSVDEALQELYELTFAIRLYPPKLGVWVKPVFGDNKVTNNKIIKQYRETLEQLGLKGKIGIYATKNQLNQITWKNHCDYWYLWLIKRLDKDKLSRLDSLLTPQFFVLNS